jgi:hypothetical protein
VLSCIATASASTKTLEKVIMMPELVNLGSNQHVVILKNAKFYFSYQTCVAYFNVDANITIRRSEKFSSTTSKHLKQMNVDHFQPVSHEEFMRLIDESCSFSIHDPKVTAQLSSIFELIDKEDFKEAQKQMDDLTLVIGHSHPELVRARTLIHFLGKGK